MAHVTRQYYSGTDMQGESVSQRINKDLQEHPHWEIVDVRDIKVDKVGGFQYELLVIYETITV